VAVLTGTPAELNRLSMDTYLAIGDTLQSTVRRCVLVDSNRDSRKYWY